MKLTRSALSIALGFGLTVQACSAIAQVAAADDTARPASNLDAVIVTGTRQSNRTVGDSQSPIQVISAKELQSSGYSDIGSILNSLLPSVDFPRQNQGAASVQRPFILRGLSPNQVIVLVDGIRYHTSATPRGRHHPREDVVRPDRVRQAGLPRRRRAPERGQVW